MGTSTEAASTPSWIQRLLIGRNPKRTLVRAAVLVAACLLLRAFVLLPVRVDGGSMLPTYRDRGIHFVNRLAYLFHEPRRGDVVAIGMLAGDHVMYMKRIVGLPGETVGFHHGRVYINGAPLDEPYVKFPGDWERPPEPIGPDHYYVVGDNRDMAWEGHTQGRAPRSRILGKIIL